MDSTPTIPIKRNGAYLTPAAAMGSGPLLTMQVSAALAEVKVRLIEQITHVLPAAMPSTP